MDKIQQLIDDGVLVEQSYKQERVLPDGSTTKYEYKRYVPSWDVRKRKTRRLKYDPVEVETEFRTLLDDDEYKNRTARIKKMCKIFGASYATMLKMCKDIR